MDATNLTPLWESKFDRIYCIFHLPYMNERYDAIASELSRVGILQSKNFQWKWTYKSPLYTQIRKLNPKLAQSEINISIAHYEIAKESYELGLNRILILEDDLAFLNDLELLYKILNNSPNTNVILYDYILLLNSKLNYNDLTKTKVNEYYADPKHENLVSAGCYSLDRFGMYHIIYWQERSFKWADCYTHWNSSTNEKITRSIPLIPLAIQKPYKSSQESVMNRPGKNSSSNRYRKVTSIKLENYNM